MFSRRVSTRGGSKSRFGSRNADILEITTRTPSICLNTWFIAYDFRQEAYLLRQMFSPDAEFSAVAFLAWEIWICSIALGIRFSVISQAARWDLRFVVQVKIHVKPLHRITDHMAKRGFSHRHDETSKFLYQDSVSRDLTCLYYQARRFPRSVAGAIPYLEIHLRLSAARMVDSWFFWSWNIDVSPFWWEL